MIVCARLRLFVAREEFDAARELGAALQALSAERSLVRTQMRGLALSMVLEHRNTVPATPTARARIWSTTCGCSPRRTTRARSRASVVSPSAPRGHTRQRGRRQGRVAADAHPSRARRADASRTVPGQGDCLGPEPVLRRRALSRAQHLCQTGCAREARRRASRPRAEAPAARRRRHGDGSVSEWRWIRAADFPSLLSPDGWFFFELSRNLPVGRLVGRQTGMCS